MTKMKNKITLIFGCILLLAVLTSCDQIAKENTCRLLPNGYELSQYEENALFAFAMEKGYIAPTSRSFDDYIASENQPSPDEMIAAMKEKFGDIAENYYWEEDLTNQCEVSVNDEIVSSPAFTSRGGYVRESVNIALKEKYNKYEAEFIYELHSHAGLWWVYIDFIERPFIREKSIFTVNDWIFFPVQKVSIHYKDDANDILKEVEYTDINFDNFNDDALFSFFDNFMEGGLFNELLAEEIKNTRNVAIRGKSKNGWCPKMKRIEAEIIFEHPAILEGQVFRFAYTQINPNN